MTDRSVLLSIKPKYCELIASGKKTVEVRKTRPKIPTPFKCYIYCTKPKMITKYVFKPEDYPEYMRPEKTVFCKVPDASSPFCSPVNGNSKVIGEFVCDGITSLKCDNEYHAAYNRYNNTCLTDDEIMKYANNGTVYYLHISDIVIYDKPKELSEFYRSCGDNPKCKECEWLIVDKNKYGELYETCGAKYEGMKPLYNDRPPQSWCYVQEVRTNDTRRSN